MNTLTSGFGFDPDTMNLPHLNMQSL